MEIIKLTFNPFQENTYILYDETRECVIIDPGCFDTNEQHRLLASIDSNDLTPVLLLNTHAHLDHVFGNAFVLEKYKIPFYAHPKAVNMLVNAPLIAKAYGLPMDPSPQPDHLIEEGDEVAFGNTRLEVLYTPGHSEGSVSLYHKEQSVLIVGDVLFAGSIGRTDLPGGNYDRLIKSIQEKFMVLPDETTVMNGHGPDTTIGNREAYKSIFTVLTTPVVWE